MQKGVARNEDVAGETIRARNGELVWVLLNHVKADKREEHENFVENILIPAAEKIDTTALRHTRFLHPTEQNEDGTYTYVFLMDPVIEGAEYEIEILLTKAYGEEKAKEYGQQWDDSLASPQVAYSLIQSKW